MKTRIGRTRINHEDLQLYFDGELTGAEAQELAAQIDAEPELRRELEQLGLMRDLVTASLERSAASIPQARFEQIWDEIDRAIETDARQREATTEPASIWSRIWAALGSARIPVVAAAGAAVLALVVLGTIGDDPEPPNKPEQVASVQQAEPEPEPMSPPDAIADAQPAPEAEASFPEPKPAQAEIHNIEFGGKSGRIGKTGTVTVLYVEEDIDEEQDSERSL